MEEDLNTSFLEKKNKKRNYNPEQQVAMGSQDNKKEQSKGGLSNKSNLNLSFEEFSAARKKRKKKPFNLNTLEDATKEIQEEDGVSFQDDPDKPNDISLDMDFSLAKKKKKSKKKDLDALFADKSKGDVDPQLTGNENADENSLSWAGTDRDYTYDELLKRIFKIILEKNPDMATGRKTKFVMRPPQVLRVGTKKTSFANFLDIAKTLHRNPKHLLDFLLAELGTCGSMDGNQQLIIKGRFQSKQIENVLRRYIKQYVTCHTCRSPDTILQKETRLYFLQCESCNSRCSVASIKSGFQAVTGKRAAMRARNN